MNGYIVSHIDVTDHELSKAYVARAPATVAAYGGRYLARKGKKYAIEGEIQDRRIVVMEFPSVEQAIAWHGSGIAKTRRSRGARRSPIMSICFPLARRPLADCSDLQLGPVGHHDDRDCRCRA